MWRGCINFPIIMKIEFHKLWKLLMVPLLLVPFVGCSDDDDDTQELKGAALTIDEAYYNINVDATETFYSFTFTANAVWKASVEDVTGSWFTLLTTSGTGGTNQAMKFEFTKNTDKDSRSAVVKIACGSDVKTINFTQAGTNREMMTEADVPNYDKFYYPGDASYTKSKESMFYSDSSYGWYHYKQSDHFFVFWDKQFGDDPNSSDVPEELRVDIDDLLAKAEGFYKTNIDILKMAETGQGKSYLDQYKMQIWLIYSTGWVATGSGYGDTIGALWVTPSTCKPVGSTIAHEIGHSFQYQVYADQVLNGAPADYSTGFRYGWGGTGGCTYWEQCAQWQSMYDYPYEKFGQDFNPWLVHYHRHFCHEWMRYQSYWLQNYWVAKHGVEAFSAIWKESASPEDPIMTYVRLYCGGDYAKFWEEYYDFASRMVTYDIDDVRQYKDGYWSLSSNYKTSLFGIGDKEYQVAYASVPETSGFNIIRLNVPNGGGEVSVDFKALAPGSALADGDAGNYLGTNEAVVGTTTRYNTNSGNTDVKFYYGFVAVVNGSAQYSTPAFNAEGTTSYNVPAGASELYMVVVPAPATYNQHAWDENDLNDETWPYSFKISGTDVFGNVYIDEDQDPQSIELAYTLSCDAATDGYELGTIDFSANGDIDKIAQAFVMQPSAISAVYVANAAPAEGIVVFGLIQPDGNITYDFTANGGYYVQADGYVGSWANQDPIWVEYNADNFILTYGHYPGMTAQGNTYNPKPCLVYTKNGVQYVVTINLTMNF